MSSTVYEWMEPYEDEGMVKWRTARSDGRVYEHPFDYVFTSAQEAMDFALEYFEVDDITELAGTDDAEVLEWRLYRVEYTQLGLITSGYRGIEGD